MTRKYAGWLWLTCCVMSGMTLTPGCSRDKYRLSADAQAYQMVAEKSNDPRWAMTNWNVYADPRSRYYDPFDPDHSPMPADDPASHRFMSCVAGMRGSSHWHDDGRRDTLDNPCWRQQLVDYARFNPSGEVVLDVDSALQLALVHSPDYQRQLETIYLSALDVTTERFRFEVQFFGGNSTNFAHRGKDAAFGSPSVRGRGLGGSRNRVLGEQNTLSTNTDAWIEKRFATAGTLLVGFANSFVWTFAGPNTNATGSLINFDLVQPLLRGAGRKIALEQLTIVERGLLANLRAYQRYRKGFYTRVAVGDLGVTGPQRRGGFFGGTGLTGFTGTGSGGLGGVGSATGFGRAGFGGAGGGAGGGGGTGFAGGGAGVVGGFIGLLQQLQQIRNTQDSLALQINQLEQLESYQEAGLITLIQVDNFRQSIETERANLLQAENGLQATLDSYKVSTLGLPPDLPVSLDDSLIRQFQFLDPRITEISRELSAVRNEIGDLPDTPRPDQVRAAVELAQHIQSLLAAHFEGIDRDFKVLDQRTPQRKRAMTAEEAGEFDAEMKSERDKLAEVTKRYQKYVDELVGIGKGITDQTAGAALVSLVEWLGKFDRLIEEASLVQARARVESVIIEPITIEPHKALSVALTNRLDVMNNRAALVDSWRLINFNANALKSNLSVGLHGDVGTTGNNPFKFQGPAGSMSASLQIDPPFTRLLERNNYRQSLIDYSRDRRQYIQFVDGLHLTIRNALRNLRQLQTNLEIQRRAVAISIRRVDLTRENLSEPKPPAAPGEKPTQFGDTAALDLLNALSDLRNTQNNFMSVWLNYYATRMVLQRDLGLMELDPDGRWIDTPLVLPGDEPSEDISAPPAVPPKLITELDQALARAAATRPAVPSPPSDNQGPEPRGRAAQGPRVRGSIGPSTVQPAAFRGPAGRYPAAGTAGPPRVRR